MFGRFVMSAEERALTKLVKKHIHPHLQVVDYSGTFYIGPDGLFRKDDMIPVISWRLRTEDLYDDSWKTPFFSQGRFRYQECIDEISSLSSMIKKFHAKMGWRVWRLNADKLPFLPFLGASAGFKSDRKRMWIATGVADASFFRDVIGFGHIGFGIYESESTRNLIKITTIFDHIWLDFRTIQSTVINTSDLRPPASEPAVLTVTCCERLSNENFITRWTGPVEQTFRHFERFTTELVNRKCVSKSS